MLAPAYIDAYAIELLSNSMVAEIFKALGSAPFAHCAFTHPYAGHEGNV
jgi:hypothetical protein